MQCTHSMIQDSLNHLVIVAMKMLQKKKGKGQRGRQRQVSEWVRWMHWERNGDMKLLTTSCSVTWKIVVCTCSIKSIIRTLRCQKAWQKGDSDALSGSTAPLQLPLRIRAMMRVIVTGLKRDTLMMLWRLYWGWHLCMPQLAMHDSNVWNKMQAI